MKNFMDNFDFSLYDNKTRIRKVDLWDNDMQPDKGLRVEWIKGQLAKGVDFFHVRADGRSLMHIFIEHNIFWLLRDIIEVTGYQETIWGLKRGGLRGQSLLMTALHKVKGACFDVLCRIEDDKPGTMLLDNEDVHFKNLMHHIVSSQVGLASLRRVKWVLDHTPSNYINRYSIFSVKYPDVLAYTPMLIAAWARQAKTYSVFGRARRNAGRLY